MRNLFVRSQKCWWLTTKPNQYMEIGAIRNHKCSLNWRGLMTANFLDRTGNFKFPVSMTRRRNHMFENTSCPCLHQHLTNIMLLSHFIFGLNSISIVSNSFIRDSQRGKIQRETKTRIKLNQSVYTFQQNVSQECFLSIHFWEEKSTWCRIKLTYLIYMQICYWKLQRAFDPMYISIISGLLGYLGIISP